MFTAPLGVGYTDVGEPWSPILILRTQPRLDWGAGLPVLIFFEDLGGDLVSVGVLGVDLSLG